MSKKSVSLIMSAYNEEATVGIVLEKLRKLEYITEMIIVDNGSTDNTHQAILNSQKYDERIQIYQIPENKGLGSGLKLAISHSKGEIVVRQDADLEYDPAELINLVKIIENGYADVVYGSRMLVRKAHKVHYYYSYIANIIITIFSNLVTNLFLSDVETAAKAFNGDIIRSIPWKSNRFEIENEITIKLKKAGCVFYEVPFSYYGRPFDEGKKIRVSDGFKAIFFIFYFSLISVFTSNYLKRTLKNIKN